MWWTGILSVERRSNAAAIRSLGRIAPLPHPLLRRAAAPPRRRAAAPPRRRAAAPPRRRAAAPPRRRAAARPARAGRGRQSPLGVAALHTHRGEQNATDHDDEDERGNGKPRKHRNHGETTTS